MNGGIRLEESRKLRGPAMEPTCAKCQRKLGKQEGYKVRTSPEQFPRTRSTSVVVLALEPVAVLCRVRLD